VAGAAWEFSRLEEARGDRTAAAVMARRARELDPDNEEGVRRLMGLLDRRGDRGGALRVYTEWQARLLDEYGVEPDPETRKLARRVQAARKGESHETAPASPPATPRSAQKVETLQFEQRSRPRRWVVVSVIAILALLASGATVFWRNLGDIDPMSIAVLPLRTLGDSALYNVSETVAEELTTAIAADTAVRVRSVLRSHEIVREARDVTQLGRRLGVAYLVEGGILLGPEGLKVTLRLLSASDAIVLWTGTYDADSTATSLPQAAMSEASNAIRQRMTPDQ
jgi:TolB-like protein